MSSTIHLFGAALDAPLMAVSARWPNRICAVDMEHVFDGWRRGTFVSACGRSGLRLVPAVTEAGATIAARWPPRLRSLPAGRVRCDVCFRLVGKMPIRSEWAGAA